MTDKDLKAFEEWVNNPPKELDKLFGNRPLKDYMEDAWLACCEYKNKELSEAQTNQIKPTDDTKKGA